MPIVFLCFFPNYNIYKFKQIKNSHTCKFTHLQFYPHVRLDGTLLRPALGLILESPIDLIWGEIEILVCITVMYSKRKSKRKFLIVYFLKDYIGLCVIQVEVMI